MGKVYERIDARLATFIEAQHVFFVATAPRSDQGRVNLSPRGLDTFRILDETTVAFVDLTGSGAETIAHLRENGRITIMFCAFEGPPKILRLQGRGEALTPNQATYSELAGRLPQVPGQRAVIRVDCQRISDSCGFGVPLYAFQQQRTQLEAWADKKGVDGVEEYQRKNNQRSIDGLPAIAGDE